MGPKAMRGILSRHRPPEAWAAVCRGRLHLDPHIAPELGPKAEERTADWARRAVTIDLPALLAAHVAATVRILTPDDDDWPERLVDDPEPPFVLFVRGELAGLERPTCGIVGTRACTPDGRRVAYALGRDLAAAGVAVVSGLALGIDAASHRGCLAAAHTGLDRGAPFGVVAGGLDHVYPPSHTDLYAAVADAGALLSEVPLGTRPERWRFPARNRLIAALSDIVVVVESPDRGGSMHTVEAGLERGRTVGAVPGPVSSVASRGTNAMLADGAVVVRDVEDVLVALGLGRAPGRAAADGSHALRDALALLGPAATAVHGAVGVSATPLEEVVAGSGLALREALVALQRLAAAGLVEDAAGTWTRIGASG
jgi:DNA processing protein